MIIYEKKEITIIDNVLFEMYAVFKSELFVSLTLLRGSFLLILKLC